ncbi:uncharacterized protein LOC135106710 [Scylla paramamosain]|uniref:uncharacterized protein LOC135106710 n=1 Tax=Scylla paramamosain TaxID=85552 RepID=UPI003083D479
MGYESLLKPCRLDTDPSSPTAAKEWKHWHRTFQNFIEESGEAAPNKLRALVNCLLLQNKSLNLEAAYSQARTLDLAQRNADAYTSSLPVPHAAALVPGQQELPSDDQQQQSTKEGAERRPPVDLTVAAAHDLSHAATDITVNGHSLKALIDSCSSDSFISEKVAHKLKLTVVPASKEISMASASLNTSSPGHKKRLCIDYSQTINQYTELDAYPLPRIEDMVHNLAKYKVFSTFDLKSAYHQISIKESERKYTAFEGAGKLYQFCRVPFGVTNGVAVF